MPVTSQGRMHDVFKATLNELAAQAAAQAAAERGTGPRPWNRPDAGWGGDPLDVPGATGAYDRQEVGANYGALIADGSNPGTIGDVISVKAQGDYVAVQERGFRARHCTPIRLAAMAAARRQGHGHPRGVLLGGVYKFAQDALKAGQS